MCQIFEVKIFRFVCLTACLFGLVVFWLMGRVFGDLFSFKTITQTHPPTGLFLPLRSFE